MLAVIAFAQLDSGNFRNCVRFIGWFQEAVHQIFLTQRLRRRARINAGRSEKQQFADTTAPCLVHHVGLHHQIVKNKVGRIGIVGVNAADFCGGKINDVNFFVLEKRTHLCLVSKFQFGVAARDQVGLSLRAQCAHDG